MTPLRPWMPYVAALLAGCQAVRPAPPPLPPADLSAGIDFSQVAIRVKQEVGFYQSTQPRGDAEWRQVFINAGLYAADGSPPPGGVCGTARITLNIQRVALDFTANYDTTLGATGGLTIPFGPPALDVSAAPNGTLSREAVGSVELRHTYYVPPTIPDSSEWDFLRRQPEAAVFKQALEALRSGLIAAAGHKPCFLDPARQAAPDPETAVFSIELKRNLNASLGFNIWLLNLSATNTNQLARANTITVTFVPSAGAEIVAPPLRGQYERPWSSTVP